MTRSRSLSPVSFLLVALVGPVTVNAIPMRLDYKGIVVLTAGTSYNLGYSMGDRISGSFEYDLSNPDTNSDFVTSNYSSLVGGPAPRDAVFIDTAFQGDPNIDRLFIRDASGLNADKFHFLQLEGPRGWVSYADLSSSFSKVTSSFSSSVAALAVVKGSDLNAFHEVYVDSIKISPISRRSPKLPTTPSAQPTTGAAAFIGNSLGGDGKLDPSKPLVVITHGWQPDSGPPSDHAPPPWVTGMGSDINSALGNGNINIATWQWDAAFTDGLAGNKLGRATSAVADQGMQLGKQLRAWGVTESTPIQLIGHSLGTLVNAYAADYLTDRGIGIDQFTILDRPFGRDHADLLSLDIDNGPNADEILFQTLLEKDSVKYVDNYWGGYTQIDGGTSIPATGLSFLRATAANFLFPDADHSGVHEKYRDTIRQNARSCRSSGGFGCSIAQGDNDWAFTEWDPGLIAKKTEDLRLGTVDWLNLNCTEEGSVTICKEGSPAYYWTDLMIPEWAEFLTFDFFWDNQGDGDWLSLFFEDNELFSFLGTTFSEDIFVNSGLIPIKGLGGKTGQLLFALNSVGDANAEFSFTNVRFIGLEAIPEPSTSLLIVLGLGPLYWSIRRRHSLNPPRKQRS